MARVIVAPRASADLESLIRSHHLPPSTNERVARKLQPLRRFPRIGRRLGGRWQGFRWVSGPWTWMIILYVHDEANDRVIVATIHDARRAQAPTASR